MNGYVVQKVGYEYNDEYYHRTEDGGGHPVVVYTNKKKAQDKADELALKYFKACEIGIYVGESVYGKKKEELNADLKKIIGEGHEFEDYYEWQLPKGLTEDQIKKVYEAFKKHARLNFYDVIETEIEK